MDALFDFIGNFIDEDAEYSMFIQFLREAFAFLIKYFSASEEE